MRSRGKALLFDAAAPAPSPAHFWLPLGAPDPADQDPFSAARIALPTSADSKDQIKKFYRKIDYSIKIMCNLQKIIS